MGYANGGRARGGSTSRKESNEGSKEKKERKASGVTISADEIRKLVARILNELASSESQEDSAPPEQDFREEGPCVGVYE